MHGHGQLLHLAVEQPVLLLPSGGHLSPGHAWAWSATSPVEQSVLLLSSGGHLSPGHGHGQLLHL